MLLPAGRQVPTNSGLSFSAGKHARPTKITSDNRRRVHAIVEAMSALQSFDVGRLIRR